MAARHCPRTDRTRARPPQGAVGPPRPDVGSRAPRPGSPTEDGGRGSTAAVQSDGTGRDARRGRGSWARAGGFPPVINLEGKVSKAMHLTRLKWALAFALGVASAGAGLASLAPMVLAAVDDPPAVKAELKKLQGSWAVTSAVEGGIKGKGADKLRLVIDGKTFTLTEGREVVLKGPFKLDLSKNPTEMDIKFEEGKMKGKNGLAIYAFDGADLKFCGVEDMYERPTDFTSVPGDNRTLLILTRRKP